MAIILGVESAAYEHIKDIVIQDMKIARKTIHDVQRYLPEIAANIATLRATRTMLNAQRNAANQLFEEVRVCEERCAAPTRLFVTSLLLTLRSVLAARFARRCHFLVAGLFGQA